MKEYRPTRETSGVLKRWFAEIKRFQVLWIEMAFYSSSLLGSLEKRGLYRRLALPPSSIYLHLFERVSPYHGRKGK